MPDTKKSPKSPENVRAVRADLNKPAGNTRAMAKLQESITVRNNKDQLKVTVTFDPEDDASKITEKIKKVRQAAKNYNLLTHPRTRGLTKAEKGITQRKPRRQPT